MILRDLIAYLEGEDPTWIVPVGFGRPDSYRGNFYDVAFEPQIDVTVGSMLQHARDALGATFSGWKGGEYTMNGSCQCYLAPRGEETGDEIGETLLGYMLGKYRPYQPGETNILVSENWIHTIWTGPGWYARKQKGHYALEERLDDEAEDRAECAEHGWSEPVYRTSKPVWVSPRGYVW